MRVAIATDHNGVEQKIELIYFLSGMGYEILDLSKDNNPSDDYPDFAIRVANAINNNEADLGILMCGTGIGMSIAANKVKGIRCAKVSSEDEAFFARQHNNANIVALSYKQSVEDLKIMVSKFLTTEFSNEERHIRRINKISELEKEWN
jgi:ribose 5-phosphate isomerase B